MSERSTNAVGEDVSGAGFRSRDVRGLPLPRPARIYYLFVAGAAFAAAVPAFGHLRLHGDDWLTFVALSVGAAVAQLFMVRTGRNHGFQTAVVFMVGGALLLPPGLVALMGLVQHAPEWIRERYAWYIQSFNVFNYTLDSLVAWAVARLVLDSGVAGSDLRFALAGLAAGSSFVAFNHLLLGTMLWLGRGHSFRESELFTAGSLSPDLVLAALGVALASLWHTNPWLVPIMLAPLVLTHRSLALLALLRASEERFRAIFESAAVGIGLVDAEGRTAASNPAFEEMLGYSKEELHQMPLQEFTHPDDLAEELGVFRELFDGSRENYRLEKRLLSKSGDVVTGQVAVALVRDADGRPQFAIKMIEDVTERKALEQQLRQAQKLEGIGRLAGGVAHDFNNLLTAIGGYSDFALERLARGEQDRVGRDIEEIKKASERAASLTRQLLAFSRKQVLQPTILQLNDVVEEMEKMLRRLIGEDVDVVTSLGANLGWVTADRGQLEQVIVNLVVNARDAMDDGGVLTIETTRVDRIRSDLAGDQRIPEGSYVVLTVADTGTGMDAHTQAQIFEPFFTTKEPGKGTGLGLATVYGIVKQTDGFVTVDTELGGGTAFRIYLPRVEAPAAVELEPTSSSAPATPVSETILLVEDEVVVRRLVREILEDRGYAVIEAADGLEALELASRHRAVDLVLTDVVMPKMGGFELADRMRKIEPGVKVLLVSGYTDNALLGRVTQVGDASFLQKPFSADELISAARALLDAPPRTTRAIAS